MIAGAGGAGVGTGAMGGDGGNATAIATVSSPLASLEYNVRATGGAGGAASAGTPGHGGSATAELTLNGLSIQQFAPAVGATGGSSFVNTDVNGLPSVASNIGAGGTLNISGSVSGRINNFINVGAVTISGSTVVQLGYTSSLSTMASLSMSSTARFDLIEGKLIVSMPAATGSWNGLSYTGITGLIASGRNGGSGGVWSGNGIITSDSNAQSPKLLTTLAIATGAQVKNLRPGQTALWAGQTISDTSTLVMYTYAGDANLDGRINGDDYFAIDSHINIVGSSGYASGDFNYDGHINGDDYFIIDSNINQQSLGVFSASAGVSVAGLGLVSAVPEPGSLGLLGVAALGMLTRRRRRLGR